MTIASLFGQSPITPLQKHMEVVASCIGMVPDLFTALMAEDYSKITALLKEISQREHEADLLKHDIRNHFPRRLFMPIDRGQLLEMVELQDKIADCAHDIAVVMNLKQLKWPLEGKASFEATFWPFLKMNLQAFQQLQSIVAQLHELAEFSFGGMEADQVRGLVLKVAESEYEADLLQQPLLQSFFSLDTQFSPAEFHLWQQLFALVGGISNLSEQLALKVRMTMEDKR